MTAHTGYAAVDPESPAPQGAGKRWKTILKRTLQVGFLFFLLKGIAWLVVGWLAWKGLT